MSAFYILLGRVPPSYCVSDDADASFCPKVYNTALEIWEPVTDKSDES